MNLLCKIIGCNHNTCAETEWFGDTLFQGFRCSRCGKQSLSWGYVKSVAGNEKRIAVGIPSEEKDRLNTDGLPLGDYINILEKQTEEDRITIQILKNAIEKAGVTL